MYRSCSVLQIIGHMIDVIFQHRNGNIIKVYFPVPDKFFKLYCTFNAIAPNLSK